jgi:hypothetical protein
MVGITAVTAGVMAAMYAASHSSMVVPHVYDPSVVAQENSEWETRKIGIFVNEN